MDFSPYTVRYVLRLMVEAESPISIGSGISDILTDSPVCLDANGLPYIPGTSLTGVLRHSFSKNPEKANEKTIFGFQEKKEGTGARLILSNACLVRQNKKVVEGLLPQEELNSDYLKSLKALSIREHCKINHFGASDTIGHGKFNNQVVFPGTRFLFEVELIGEEKDKNSWEALINILHDPLFRIGGGTRKGYGKLKILENQSETKIFQLDKKEDLKAYLNKSSSLNEPLNGTSLKKETPPDEYKTYKLTLTPESTWLFGSGLSDYEADMTPVYEKQVQWNNNKPSLIEKSSKKILIPASSIKGAISHRVAFHYNLLKKNFADEIINAPKDFENYVGENNKAVLSLFGCAKNSQTNQNGQIGRVILSDILLPDKEQTKVFNHVSLDRFTGGVRSGFLFDEKVITQQEPEIILELIVLPNADDNEDEDIQKALKNTLNDICDGQLPLGGSVMRGHGVFAGTLE